MTFFTHLLQNFRLSRQICHLQLNSGQNLFYFASKVTTFEDRPTSCRLRRYNKCFTTRPRPPAIPTQDLGVVTPKPPGLTPMQSLIIYKERPNSMESPGNLSLTIPRFSATSLNWVPVDRPMDVGRPFF